MNDAENNLWQFYEKIGRQKDYSFRRCESWSEVSAPPGIWPSFIFNIDIQKGREHFLNLMVDGIRIEGAPASFIADSDLFGPEYQQILRRNHFFPVDKWTLMEIYPGLSETIPVTGSGNSVRQIRDFSELIDFSSLVNSVLFRRLPLDAGLMSTLTKMPDFLVYGLFCGSELVSGLLVFIRNNVAGLYLVVTKKEMQNRGFGSILLIDTINKLKSGGIWKIILHSSVMAVPFYKRSGFSVTGEMYIYRYLSS